MPELVQVLGEEDLARRGTGVGLDLTPYFSIIDSIREQGGVGAQLRLEEGETQRTVKRRMSVAAKQRGYELVWRKSQNGQLRFVLAEPGQPRPGGRPRRTSAERQDEQTTIEAVMTEDVAEVTDTTARVEDLDTTEAATGPVGRRRSGRRQAR